MFVYVSIYLLCGTYNMQDKVRPSPKLIGASLSWDHVESPAMSDSGCELSQMSYGHTWEAGGAVEPQLWLEIVHGCTWHVLSRTA